MIEKIQKIKKELPVNKFYEREAKNNSKKCNYKNKYDSYSSSIDEAYDIKKLVQILKNMDTDPKNRENISSFLELSDKFLEAEKLLKEILNHQ
jgi:hypothetical protein